MSWIQKLHETYENCHDMIGAETAGNEVPLIPICHTTQKAHIEIVIDDRGNFKRARVIPKKEARTIIPATEASAGRAGIKPQCHPLCDNLQYIAADFTKYGGTVTKGFIRIPGEPHASYIHLLTNWCESSIGHPKAKAVLLYVKKGDVIQDLINHQVILVDQNRKFLQGWDKKLQGNPPEIFSALDAQEDAFVRWEVVIPEVLETKVWKDKTLWDSWIKYYSGTKREKALCYVTGENDLIAEQHPAKLRNDADKAKLISSNDLSGFTFRGRFITADQACSIGFETSQKAHFALRWLISRQGYRHGDQAIVAWATTGVVIPQPTDDWFALLDMENLQNDSHQGASTAQELALKLKQRMLGYGREIGNTTNIVVIGLDAATPGRMAITFYRELSGSQFLQRIISWHESCQWIHTYRSIEIIDIKGKKNKLHPAFVGAPAPGDIAEAAYGNRIDEKLKKVTVERLLPCIIDGMQIPMDLVESAIRRASNRLGKENWEWNKSLSIACALYRKYHMKEEYTMALDPNRKTRDYLYGRLLAIADHLEGVALYKAKEKRDTNAARYMQQFADHPYKTWKQIYLSLSPYMARLNGANYYKSMIDEVMCKFDPAEEFTNDKSLTGEFLLGYHCQRASLWKKNDEDASTSNEN
jgi:CRISPR-associated protein Csd1